MASPIAPGSLAGRPSRSSTTISDDRAEASPVQASSGCWPQSVTAELALCSRSRLHRLARNGRDWHTLIEFCGQVGTILVDEDGIYDPRHPNDRLLLGMKGTMSELELSLFRQRSQKALRQMARRGDLVLGVAAGYVKVGCGRIEKNPDKRVQQAITNLVFTKFCRVPECAAGACLALRDEVIELPAKSRRGVCTASCGACQPTTSSTTSSPIPSMPALMHSGARRAGSAWLKVASAFAVACAEPIDEWDVQIKDHHAAYITWDEFERNLKAISRNNATWA